MAVLEVDTLDASYGDVRVLHGVSLYLDENETVAVLGRNAVGKTTLLRAISGVEVDADGSVKHRGEEISHLDPHERVDRGVIQVPQGRGLFAAMSVAENLMLGGYRNPGGRESRIEEVLEVLPELVPLRSRPAGHLSGGQQQILAIARALVARPDVLLLDEPSLGLAPVLTERVYEVVARIRAQMGLSVLLVEQEVDLALESSDRAYVLDEGSIRMEGYATDLATDPDLQRAFIGGSPTHQNESPKS